MGAKRSSVDRAFNLFAGKSLAEITLIQSAAARKDYAEIKRLTGKPATVSDAYAAAIGRLSNQYVTAVANPTRTVKSVANRRYGVTLTDTGNASTNLQTNINTIRRTTPPTKKTTRVPKKTTLPTKRTTRPPKKTTAPPPRPPIGPGPLAPRIFPNLAHTQRWDGITLTLTTTFAFTRQTVLNELIRFRGGVARAFALSNPRNIRTCRLTIRYRTQSGQVLYLSTRRVPIAQFSSAIRRVNSFLNYRLIPTWQRMSPDINSTIADFNSGADDIVSIEMVKIEYRI